MSFMCSWNNEYVVRFLQSLELTDAAKIAQKERIDGPTLISLVRLYDYPIDRTGLLIA